MLPPERPQKGSTQHLQNRSPVLLFLFSCPSLALLRLLILLLLLMSGNVHPNPGPIFPCSVCAGNVTWRGKWVQCCTCSKWVHPRCSQLSLSHFRALGSSHSWSWPPCRNTVTLSSDSSGMYTSTVQSGHPSTDAALTRHPRLQTSYLPSAHSISPSSAPSPPSLAPGRPSTPPASSPPLTLSGFLNEMLEVSVPGALNYFTFFHPIQSTLSASRNPILTPLPLYEFLDSLLCILIALTPGLAFSLLMPRTPAAALSFSSGRAYPFLNNLPPLFLRLISTLIMWRSTSLLTTSPWCHFLMGTPPLFAVPQRMAEPTPSLPPFFPLPEITSFWGTSIAITPSGTQESLPNPAGRKYSIESSPLTSSPSMTLTHPLFSIAPLAVAPLLTSLLLLLLLPFLAPGRCFRTWVLTIYQVFYLSLSLRSFAPTSVPLPSIFRKLAGMVLPPTLTFTVHPQRNTHLFLFPLLLLTLPLWHWMRPNLPFLSAASNALLKPGGLLRWKVRLVKDARLSLPLTEVMKIARLTSLLLDAPCLSSPRPRLRHGRQLALLFHLGLALNLCTLIFAISLAHLPRFPPLLTSPTVLLPGNRLQFMPLTWDPTFPFLS